jgi:Zn ribbon nucleic-acid-binding protein
MMETITNFKEKTCPFCYDRNMVVLWMEDENKYANVCGCIFCNYREDDYPINSDDNFNIANAIVGDFLSAMGKIYGRKFEWELSDRLDETIWLILGKLMAEYQDQVDETSPNFINNVRSSG